MKLTRNKLDEATNKSNGKNIFDELVNGETDIEQEAVPETKVIEAKTDKFELKELKKEYLILMQARRDALKSYIVARANAKELREKIKKLIKEKK